MKAFVFPGQGAQFTGMGKDLYETNEFAHALMEKANDILGFRITDTMFEGSAEELKQTRITQPAVFLHSVVSALALGDEFQPDMVGGHSLGEFSALVAAGALSIEDGLRLVFARAQAMQSACEAQPGTMAAILGLPDETVENVCKKVSEETGKAVVAANYNCPGQLVISGNVDAIGEACTQLKEAGAKRAVVPSILPSCNQPRMSCRQPSNVQNSRHLVAPSIKMWMEKPIRMLKKSSKTSLHSLQPAFVGHRKYRTCLRLVLMNSSNADRARLCKA